MKWLLLALIATAEISCTTLVTRRDLYSPEPGPDSWEAKKQWASTTVTTTTTTTTTTEPEVAPQPIPQFR